MPNEDEVKLKSHGGNCLKGSTISSNNADLAKNRKHLKQRIFSMTEICLGQPLEPTSLKLR